MKPKTYPKEDDKADTIKKLRGILRQKEKQIKQLKSELSTLESALTSTSGYVRKQLWDYSVEEVVDAAKKKRRLEATNKPDTIQCGDCSAPMDVIGVPVGKVHVCTQCDNRYTIKRVA